MQKLTLQLENITVSYGKRVALKNISLSMSSGTWGFIGPNGAGKTTLLKTIVGIQKFSNGEILCNGSVISSQDVSFRKMIGYLPQQFGFYDELSLFELMNLIAKLQLREAVSAEEATSFLKKVNLHDRLHSPFKSLSGGMKQRFGVVAALLHHPEIVLLDEPTSSLDPIERQRIFSLLRDYSPSALILLSSHNVSELAGFVENVIIISGGEIQYAGSVKDLRSRYEGKIWESEETIEGAMLLGELYNGNVHVKHYFSEQPLSAGTPVMPSLDDCALHILGGKE